jgi:predicted RNase H-like HicB family nuclease
MSLTLEQIVEDTRRSPDELVAELIDRIVIAKHGGMDADHAAQWDKVAEDRLVESERDLSVLGVRAGRQSANSKKRWAVKPYAPRAEEAAQRELAWDRATRILPEMRELVFEVTQEADGGFVAESLGEGVITQADTWEELRVNVREAVAAYFFDRPAPDRLRLHFVRDEVLA